MTECRNPECIERDQIAATRMAEMIREINRLQEKVKEQDAELAQCRGPAKALIEALFQKHRPTSEDAQ